MDHNAKGTDDRSTATGKDAADQPIVIRKLDQLETTGHKCNIGS
jgi:hypothetical protein